MITQELTATLLYDFTPVLKGYLLISQIFLSLDKAYVILNYGIEFYEMNLSNLAIRMIAIPFQIQRLFPFGNILVLTNDS